MRRLLLLLVPLSLSSISYSQKKPLDHSVYDSWQSIGERMISNDGKWVVYAINVQQGDNELVIQSADAKYKKTIARGYNAVISEDSRYAIFKIRPLYKDTRDARIKKKRPDDMPKDSLGIVELGKDSVWKIATVKTYKTPEKEAGWLAYHLEKSVEKKEPEKTRKPETNNDKRIADSLKRIIDSLENVIQTIPRKKKGKDGLEESGSESEWESESEFTIDHSPFTIDHSRLTIDDFAEGDDPAPSADAGTDLVVRNLGTAQENVFHNVLDYYFSKKGGKLLIRQARNPKDSLSKPVILLVNLNNGLVKAISRNGNDFKNFSFSEDGTQVAYLAERDAKPRDLQKFYRLWYYRDGMDSATLLVDKNTVGMKLGSTVSEYGNVSFSKSGRRVFFGTAPIQPPRDTSIIDIDMPRVDIWHYKDDYLQTVQNYPVRLRAAQQENFLAVYDLDAKKMKQLGSADIPQVIQTVEGDGDIFVGVTDVGKRIESQWQGGTLKDIYAIDVATGERKLIKANLQGVIYPSPGGKYIMWYDRKAKNYFTWDGKTMRNISAKIKLPLWNEDSQVPDDPGPYGVMGWQEGDSAVYVYDKYDAWQLDPASITAPKTITRGRPSKSTFRNLRVDDDERFIKASQALYFRVLNETTKVSSIVSITSPDMIGYFIAGAGPYLYNVFLKSRDGSVFLYSKESYTISPDLYVTTDKISNESTPGWSAEGVPSIKLSSINPQQSNYLWGTSELFKWKAYNGKEATGIVYKPENFDPKKKYPMIVYFYEKLSNDLNDYKEPAPIRSAINVPFFVSRGYVIFMPDIHYTTGHPGKNAYDYIVSGSRALVKKGWVDSTKMALQGHSWGGYQAAQVATMTKLFKAIWAGAPVANMTSAYGGIRWESGMSRQFQYEKTQSRIGATLWEKPQLYIENSPLFHLNKVTAPMVIMHNDADGAVPWYQGIELFTGLRRLGKKVWMFNYNGQGHGLTQRQDMRDYQIRMQQFFDWILKGDKPAKWITDGVPAVKKGKDWGLEVVD